MYIKCVDVYDIGADENGSVFYTIPNISNAYKDKTKFIDVGIIDTNYLWYRENKKITGNSKPMNIKIVITLDGDRYCQIEYKNQFLSRLLEQ